MLITNDNGDLEWATIEDIVQANETITDIADNGDGTYTYTNEEGDTFVIDVPASVVENFETIVNSGPVNINGEDYTTIEEYITYLANTSINLEGSEFINITGSGTDTDPYVVAIEGGTENTMLITDANGDVIWATIEDIVQGSETVTTLVDNLDGTYTYTSEDGTVTVIDVPASVVENFESIYNQIVNEEITVHGDTYNTFEEYLESIVTSLSTNIEGSPFINVTGTGTIADPYVVSIEEGDANSMLITNDNGDLEWATIEDIVQGNETVTTLVDNLDGTYTYTSEDGTVTIIDVPASVVENFESIYNQIVNEEITVHGDTYNTFEEYLESIVTSLSTNIEGSPFINVTGTGTIADPYVVSIEEGDFPTRRSSDLNGDLEWATIEDIVQGNETVTTLVDNLDGTYTYTSEDGTVTVIDVPASVVENFETIVNSGPVNINGEDYTTIEEYITYLANTSINLEGSEFINITGSGTDTDPYVVAIEGGAENTMLITDANGDVVWATIEDIVQGSETVTTLVDNLDGTYTYTSEDGTVTVIDVPASVVEN